MRKYYFGTTLLALSFVLGAAGTAVAQCLAARDGSPYDFQSQPHVLFETDFSNDPLNRFPKSLEFKTGALQVAEWQGRRVLKASDRSAFAIPLDKPLPQQFTLEVGVVHRNTKQVGAYTVDVYGGRNFDPTGRAKTHVMFGGDGWWVTGGGANTEGSLRDDYDGCVGQQSTLRIAVDGNEIMVYGDERPLGHVPNGSFARTNGVVIQVEARDDNENAVYITNVRLSGSQPLTPAVVATSAPQHAAPVPAAPPAAPIISSPPAAPVTLPTPQPEPPRQPEQPQPTTAPAPQPQPAPQPATQPPAATNATTARQPAQGRTSGRELTSATAPKAPTNLAAKYLSGGRIALAWDAAPGAESYDIQYTTPTTQLAGLNIDPITNNQHVSRQLGEGVYTLAVRATSSGGVSEPSQTVTVTVPRWYGKYRVTINGFRVNKETADNPYEVDGKRDEIYVQATSRVMHTATGVEVQGPQTVRTYTHGDVNHARWQNPASATYRINAGSASAKGGLMSGDAFPDRNRPWKRASATTHAKQFPLLVWEGDIMQDFHTVVIVPAVYEDDEKPGGLSETVDFMGLLGKLAHRPRNPAQMGVGTQQVVFETSRALIKGFHSTAADARDFAINRVNAYGNTPQGQSLKQEFQSEFDQAKNRIAQMLGTISVAGNLADRPIGLKPGGLPFDPAAIFLSFEEAEAIIAGTAEYSFEPGIIEINYKDQVSGGNGDYTIFVEVQRIQ